MVCGCSVGQGVTMESGCSWRYHDGMRGTKCNKGNSNWVLGKKKSPLEGDQTLEEDPDRSLLLEMVKTHPAKALSNLF